MSSKTRLRRYNVRLEEPSSSEPPSSEPSSSEPSSSEPSSSEPFHEINKDQYRILWKLNTQFYTWTNDLGYPRPQGNIPMLLALTPQKQDSLLRAYFSVHGDNVEYANQDWKPYESPN